MAEVEIFEVDDCYVVKESGKAILVSSVHLDADEWVPKSQILDESCVPWGKDEGSLIVTYWFAEKQGWTR